MARSCPVCPECGGRRFERLRGPGTLLRCRSCGREAGF